MIFRLIKYQIIFYLLVVVAVAAVFAPLDFVDKPKLRTGDVIFQTSLKKPSLAFVLLTRSIYDNVGIVVFHNGKGFVLQAGETVDFMPFEDWIAQGVGQRYAVWRHSKMVDSDITRMMLAVKPYFHKPYDMLMHPDNNLLYSSELVYELFRAANLNIGYPQSIRDLVGNNIFTHSLAEQMKSAYPDCGKKSVDECEELLLGQKVITPASLIGSEEMEPVYSSYLGGLL